MKQIPALVCILAGLTVAGADSLAQTTVILPDTSQTTGIVVNIMEQATVTIPSITFFTVANISVPTVSGPATVALSGLLRKTSSTGVALSLRANAAQFTPPQSGAPTWSAADVSWAPGTWTGATGSAGVLSHASFTRVATCATDGCSTNTLQFTLGPKPSVTRSGQHTLVVTWKIESLQ
jgi:hypothetical protein